MQNSSAAVLEQERRDRRVELLAVLGHAEVAAVHGPVGRAQPAAAGVAERLAGLEQRLTMTCCASSAP